MAELDRILGEAQDTHHSMQEAVRNTADKPARDIVRLRTKFATLLAELMGAIKADPRLNRDPDLAREFEGRFIDMRHSLSEHQAKWRSTEIDADPDAYRTSTAALGARQDEFYDWAKAKLASL
jgi:hypothetical protein